MGSKASNFFQSDRPESGGANKDEAREKSGLLDRDQQKVAQSDAEKQAAATQVSEGKSGLQNGVETPRNNS